MKSSSTTKTPLKSILKSPAVSPGSSPKNTSGVHFEPPPNLEETLKAAAENNLRGEELDGFITHMKNQKGGALVDWLQQVQMNLTMLKPSLETFVLAILSISWADQERPVVTAYKNFLENLISSQSYYTKPVIRMLMMLMMGPKDINDTNPDLIKSTFDNVHEVLHSIIKISPLATHSAILSYGKSCMPFIMTPMTHMHTNFVMNLLKMTEYFPTERLSILTLVVDRLVQLDANLPIGEDLYEDEEDDDNVEQKSDDDYATSSIDPVTKRLLSSRRSRDQICRDNLDQGMKVMFEYIKKYHEVDNNDSKNLNDLYQDLLKVFESNVMPSYATGHVQYLMFYICGLRPEKFALSLCEWFWRQFISLSTPSISRQTAVAYIASMIARAKYIPVIQLRTFLKRITNWIHSYLSARSDVGMDYSYVNVKAHGPFYAACQAILYIIAFRQDEITQGHKSLEFLSKLGLGRIVTCSLNPLKVCLPPVVKNFASMARHYQLAYCETVIQRNARLDLPVVGSLSSNTSVIGEAKPCLLDTFFPFDPYRLRNSKAFILDMYREYQGTLDEEDDSSDSDEDGSDADQDNNDEKLEFETPPPPSKRRRLNSSGSYPGGFPMMLDYEASPGFLKVDFN